MGGVEASSWWSSSMEFYVQVGARVNRGPWIGVT